MNKVIYFFRILFTILLLFTYIIIFSYSSESGEKSSTKSKGIMYSIICILNGKESATDEEVKAFEPLLRKLAHFGIYTMSGIWSMSLMNTFFRKNKKDERSGENYIDKEDAELNKNVNEANKSKIFNNSEKKRVCICLVMGFLYACSDEIHQLFSQGRSGKAVDVFIDTMGVLNGILLVMLICKIYETMRKKG